MTVDLSDLNPAQRDAVTTTEGPLLVLAGAGSGKTRVLTQRIAHIVGDRGTSPAEILAITFTNKAAEEMRSRLGDLVGPGVRAMWVMTFHAMCVRMLRADAELAGLTRSFTIYDADDAKRMIISVMKDLEFDPKRYPVNAIAARISAAKNELIEPAEFASTAVSPVDKAAAKVFPRYRARTREANALDFDDLLVEAHRLLAKYPEVLEAYQDRFRYVLVDEYQDTNHAQYRIVSLLAAKRRNLMVVGDDDQSIYSWRGADIRNILEFERDYPDATVIRLEQNYRSTATILAAANAVVANNKGRKPKTLWTANAGGESISRYYATDERDEARFVATEIERLLREEGRSYADMAVFYRTNAQSRVLEDVFLRTGVPYQIVGGTRFFDRAEIRDVMAYVKAAVNPADEIALKRIINKPKRGIGDSTVSTVEYEAAKRGMSFESGLRFAVEEGLLGTGPRTRVAAFVELLGEIREQAGSGGGLRELLEEVVALSGLVSALEAERSIEADGRIENIRELFGVVDEFAAAHEGADLPAFMEWVALRTDIDTLVEGERAVTLMTVHTAKGLEFPVVYIVGLEDSIFPHANSMFDESGLEEERRLAYVGITRARERLYLTHAHSRSLFGSTQHNPPSRFIGEIPEKHVVGAGLGSTGVTGTGFTRRGAASRGSMAGTGRSEPGGRVFGSGQSRSPRPVEERETFETGDVVDHKVFGLGTVTGVDGDKITVSFRTAGTKKLLAGFAPLRKVRD
ncbi:MAG: UvrD-helicase domain-containing protein [Coriobacteriia bacterium]|nr:UvrD-helicase domain-containing protein [Coriobacteriia bacterium]